MSTVPRRADSQLRVLVVTFGMVEIRSALRAGLLAAGCDIVASVPADAGLPTRVGQLRPDLVVIDAPADGSGALALLRGERLPVVVFTDDQRSASTDAAMTAGVSGYIVGGLQAERVRPVLQVALARFRQEQKLQAELDATRLKLAERKVVDRAKGVLMESQSLTEDQAYQKLRSLAMNKNMKLSEIAQRILDVEDLLG